MNFIVYAPGDYACFGGGSIALHKLAHNISSLGEQCFIMTSKKNPNYLGIQIDEKQAAEMAKYGQSMVIYPEVTEGNPLGSPHIMRWILYYVREEKQHGIFGANDLIYKYAPMFTLRYPHEVHGELRAMELNLDLFVDHNRHRNGTCYIKKKNPDKEEIHPEGSICLDKIRRDENYLSTLAEIFNNCKTLYAYDDATWLSIMAALCGCMSIVVPREGVTAAQWHSQYPYFKYGIAYGLDDMDYRERTAHLVREMLIELETYSLVQAKEFIDKAKEVVG